MITDKTDTLMMMGFGFQLLTWTDKFLLYSVLICIHKLNIHTVNRGRPIKEYQTRFYCVNQEDAETGKNIGKVNEYGRPKRSRAGCTTKRRER